MLRLFYFSGTGNARNVARWMASAWQSAGREVEVADLATIDPGAVHVVAGDEVGLASPTHGFNFPPITLRFLFAFPRAPGDNRVFIVNTRAGVRARSTRAAPPSPSASRRDCSTDGATCERCGTCLWTS
jgi:hypothetical protein